MTLLYTLSLLEPSERKRIFEDAGAFKNFIASCKELAFLESLYWAGPKGILEVATGEWIQAVEQMALISASA